MRRRSAAEPLGLGIVAAGMVPLAHPQTLQITPDPRYEHMRGSTGSWSVNS